MINYEIITIYIEMKMKLMYVKWKKMIYCVNLVIFLSSLLFSAIKQF